LRRAALHGAVAEPLRLGPLATVELGGVGRLPKGQLCVRLALEGGPDRLEGELAGGSDHDNGSRSNRHGSEHPEVTVSI